MPNPSRTNRITAALCGLVFAVAVPVAATSACGCPTADAAASTSGCSAGGSGGGGGETVQPCSPGIQRENEFGRIAVQQAGPQQAVAWGVYPTNPAGTYTLTITVDGQIYDKKTQAYPPHGSTVYDRANKRLLPSGGTFAIDGTIVRPDGSKEGFYFRCTLA
jgi:hypothetical protein